MGGFASSPAHRNPGDVVGVADPAFQCALDQVIQHHGYRLHLECINKFLVAEGAPQTIAAEQQHIAGLQLDRFSRLHHESSPHATKALCYLVALRMIARLFCCDHALFKPQLDHRMVARPRDDRAVAQKVNARISGMPPIHHVILDQYGDTGCPRKTTHIPVMREPQDALMGILHGGCNEFIGVGNARLRMPAKRLDKGLDRQARRQFAMQMPAHAVRQHKQQRFIAVRICNAILVVPAIADMAGLVYREIHKNAEIFTGCNRNIMRLFSTVFYSKAIAMILSMTGYASASAELDSGSLTLELRAVNHRYLDIQLRMPDELRGFENALREAITAQLQRGKVECRINFTSRTAQSGAVLNHGLLQQLAAWSKEVQDALPDARSLSVADVLRWNGMLEAASASADELRAALLDLMQTALQEFSASRAREGEKLKDFLLQRVEKIEALRTGVMPHVPAAIAAYEQKLITRLREAIQNAPAQDTGASGIGDERVRQEITLFASKIDVDEELSRLDSHLTEMRRILAQGGAVGKRLDFLMQELNREANTLGSKSVDAEVSRTAMEMKILIEQMREQIQNLE